MKPSKITLVRRVNDFSAQLDKLGGPPAKARRLLTTKKASKPRVATAGKKKAAKATINPKPQSQGLRVGILDLGAWMGNLRPLLEELNRVQTLFELFEVQSPVPGGLIKSPDGMMQWAAENGVYTGSMDVSEFEPQMIADEFFLVAEDIRKALKLSRVVGVTAPLIAGVEEDSVYWNHFASGKGKTILISTKDVRSFAEQAHRPFAAAVGALLIGALLANVNDKITYHDDTGCIFDYNGSRISLVNTFTALRIDSSCFQKLTPKQRISADSMLTALRAMKRKSS
jgi:hypothetical protein